jgi:hypothetical protein
MARVVPLEVVVLDGAELVVEVLPALLGGQSRGGLGGARRLDARGDIALVARLRADGSQRDLVDLAVERAAERPVSNRSCQPEYAGADPLQPLVRRHEP